ncbi:carboxypeptidase-like regulatory domain-containing protein [Carboxylicivirga sp. A043]|uniref:DUF5686 and carboxypeptidase-like regulatory domain-containing protein n=1 Tax=Carboxylicivirga litoralis TaxID=2816963 RepID=UPI0021CB6741|nr:DUF5686 and carboxypeptidase-like regulatory domain-containing protein [Carboxylicivirga sp. A043]MCU4156739.1 carboxypeptidase-like regulatory domain-containing protein [Carboxylicivirga sp. A043]
MKKIFKYILLIVIFSLHLKTLFAQEPEIKGIVKDAKDESAIPMVNIYFKGTFNGTVSGADGEFSLKNDANADTLVFSSIGYHSKELVYKKHRLPLTIYLKAEDIELNEVSVKPDDSRIRWLMKNLVKNKAINNPESHERYTYEKYTRWQYYVTNVDSSIMNSNSFRKHQSLFRTSADGSRYLPVYLSEQVVNNEFQRKPLLQKSTIIADKTKGLGVLGDYEISGYTAGLDMQYNFYTNFIKVFEENFVSPAATNGWFYYDYYIQDSTVVNNSKQFEVLFVPKRKHDKVFRGTMVVDENGFDIVKINAELSSKTNLNFLKTMSLEVAYQTLDSGQPFYKTQKIDAKFDYLPFDIGAKQREMGLDFTQQVSFRNIKINPQEEIKLSARSLSYESIKLSGSYDRDESYWANARHITISEKEEDMYQAIDSINNIPIVKVMDNSARMFMTGYYDIGKFELGPYMDFFQANKIEGFRMFVGGRTSKEISRNWMFWGGLGYGTRTKRFTGSSGLGYKFKTPKRKVFKLFYDDRYIRMGENRKILYLYENMLTPSENNLVSAFFVRDEFNELHRQQNVSINYEHEWRTGLSSRLNLEYRKQFSPEYYPFIYQTQSVDAIDVYEATLDFRFSFQEKIIDDEFMRLYVSSDYPIVNLAFTAGRATFNNESLDYTKLHATIKHRINIGQTYFRYALEGGAIMGKVPFTLLEIPRGNETYGYYNYDFNMLNYLEYAHDKYVHLYADYHLNGFFFNRMPFFKNLGLREVFSAKAMYGSLSDKQRETIELPGSVQSLDQPYVELGAGLENIIRLFRIEAIWRLTPHSQIGAPEFGIRAKFELHL